MKFLIVDKSKRAGEPEEPRTAVKRLQEELDLRKISHDFCEFKDISIETQGENFTLRANGIDLKEYTHVILRGHRVNEYKLKQYIAMYGKKNNIHVQNADFILAMPHYNKLFQMVQMTQNGIPYLDSFYTPDGQYHKHVEALNRIGFPLIYKHTDGEYRIEEINGQPKLKKNVFLINNLEELEKQCTQRNDPELYFIQRFASIGEDYRAMYIGGKFYGGFKRAATQNFITVSHGEYTAYDQPSPEFLEICNKTASLFKAEYCAIDVIYENGKPYVLEINMSPGFKAFETKIEGKKYNVAGAIIDSMIK